MLSTKAKAELVKKYGDEQVFVVPYNKTKRIPDKFTPAENLKIPTSRWESDGTFVFRYDAEYNATLQQLIPYIVVVNAKNDSVYVTERIAGEERLRGSLALGCGGHINPVDAGNIIMNAAMREMNEELDIKLHHDKAPYFTGYIRDMASETNDHLGLVFVAVADSVSVKETENLKGQWMKLEELIAEYSRFESWARHIIDHLYVTHAFDKIFI